MLESLNQFIVRCSFSVWKFVMLVAGFAGTLRVMQLIGERFKEYSGGSLPFDLQNSLNSEQVYAQLANYTDYANTLYYIFSAIDFFFPLLAGLMLATICAFVLRHSAPQFYESALQRNLFPILLIPTLFDWLENLTLLATIITWPESPDSAITAAVLAKQVKLGTTALATGATVLVILYGMLNGIKKLFTR